MKTGDDATLSSTSKNSGGYGRDQALPITNIMKTVSRLKDMTKPEREDNSDTPVLDDSKDAGGTKYTKVKDTVKVVRFANLNMFSLFTELTRTYRPLHAVQPRCPFQFTTINIVTESRTK